MPTLRERLGNGFLDGVPRTPGVYFMLGARDELLYVGKAVDLRARLRSYLATRPDRNLTRLVTRIRAVRWEECATESDALARESELLRTLRPPFNVSQTTPTEYLSVASVTSSGGRRFWVSDTTDVPGATIYGSFPFGARLTEAFGPFVRVACAAAGTRAPSRPLQSSGVQVRADAGVLGAIDAFLSGRSPRLLTMASAAAGDGDPLERRSVERDVVALREFFAFGPQATRKLAKASGVDGPMSGEQLARAMGEAAAAPAPVAVDRHDVESRIRDMRDAGKTFRQIASRLNADRIPRPGGRGWRPGDVAVALSPTLSAPKRIPRRTT